MEGAALQRGAIRHAKRDAFQNVERLASFLRSEAFNV